MPDTAAVASVTSPSGIWADVTIDVTLEPYAEETDRINATVTISATNDTDSKIELREPYRLPARGVQNVTSTLDDGAKLPTTKHKDGITVHFPGRGLSAHQVLTWTITYARAAELYLNHILAYDLFIDPLRDFQGVPIRNHHVNLRVTILTPDDARWRPLRRWYLYQRNYPLHVKPTLTQSRERAICDFPAFDLTDQTFDLRIAAVYGFKGLIAHAFQLAVAAVIVVLLEHGPALLLKLLPLE